MNEQAAWAEVPSVASVIRSLNWSDSAAYMYLERVPRTWVDEPARQSGILLAGYDANASFDTWPRGRVFNAQHDFRGDLEVVLTSPSPTPCWHTNTMCDSRRRILFSRQTSRI